MSLYMSVYLGNLLLAFLIMVGAYWLAVNEVKIGKRFHLVFLSLGCAIECTILTMYIPWAPSRDVSDWLISTGVTPSAAKRVSDLLIGLFTTLLVAKFVLKPALMGNIIYDILDMRRKMKRSAPHGQKAALLPQPLETVQANQVAAAKGKLDQAVDVAATLKAHDSAVLEENL